MAVTKIGLFYAFWLIPGVLLAGEEVAGAVKQSVRVFDDRHRGLIGVEARQAPLSRVLDEIAGKLGIRLHHAVLPETPITAACAGETINEVMACLLGSDANFVLRYPDGAPKGVSRAGPAEIWVLGTSPGDRHSSLTGSGCMALLETENETVRTASAASDMENLEMLVDKANAQDPEQRVDAISRLAAEGQDDGVTVRTVLENALTDEEPEVRAQAIYGVAKRGGPGTSAILEAALNDRDSSVRLMAVDNIMAADTESIELLRQALSDNDRTVSALAAMKLESLRSSTEKH